MRHWLSDPTGTVVLRPVGETDLEFLRTLYASTRREELAPLGWPRKAEDAFLESQFDLQHQHYTEHYVGAEFLVVEEAGAPVGRLYVHEGADEVRLMDVALVPERRGRGLGTRLMRAVMDRAEAAGLPVRLHVEAFNPAVRFYHRLGFHFLEDRGVYQFLEWRPSGP